jgi:fatty acid-binding protein DegV
MKVLENIKDIQKLTGRLATLNKFISKSAERSLPIFQALKGTKKDFAWGPSQQHAFEEIKRYLSKPNTLATPNPGKELLLYVSAIENAVNAVLVQEQENDHSKKQVLVYFVSKAMFGSKIYYSEIEKIAYAVLTAARKLKHYFQAHKIRVPTNHPLKEVLQSCKSS